jgi:hypothetical protein
MLTVTSPATTTNLAQLATVKTLLGLTDASQDAVLTLLIGQASDTITDYCNVGCFAQQSYSETVRGYGTNQLALSRTPIVTLTSVALDGTLVPTTQYELDDPAAGMIQGIVPWLWTAEIRVDLFLYGASALPRSEQYRYTVVYTAGYNLPGDTLQSTPLPRAIEHACVNTVTAWYVARYRDPYLKGATVGDQTLSYAQEDGSLPPRARALLAPYVRYSV